MTVIRQIVSLPPSGILRNWDFLNILSYNNSVLHLVSHGSFSRTLGEGETALLKPVCKSLNMPLQPPVVVLHQKKATKEDQLTGRIITYSSINLKHTSGMYCSAFVSLDTKAYTDHKFGQIESFFTYRAVQFAVIDMFECTANCLYGLTRIPDTKSTVKVIVPMEEVSPPLPVAIDHDCSELWILSL